MRTHLPGLGGRRSGRRRDGLGLDEHGDDGAGAEAEAAMAQDTEEGADLAGVAGDGDEQILLFLLVVEAGAFRRRVGTEDGPVPQLVQHGERACVLGRTGLGGHAVPELVALGEARLDAVGREGPLDDGLVAAAIARVDGDVFAQLLKHDGRVSRRHGARRPAQPVKRRRNGLQAACERADVEEVRRMDLLLVDQLLPKVVRDLGLRDPVDRQLGVGPGCRAVAVQFGPVALKPVSTFAVFQKGGESYVPGWRAVEGLCRIVPTFSMASQEEDLILDVPR